MANGNLGYYLSDKYPDDWKRDLEEGARYFRTDFETYKNLRSREETILLEKRLKEIEEMVGQDKPFEMSQAIGNYMLVGLCVMGGAELPEKRAEEIKKEADGVAKRVLEEVKKKVTVPEQKEQKIIECIALDVLTEFMWGIHDGPPLSINSSLLELVSADAIQRGAEAVVECLEETASS